MTEEKKDKDIQEELNAAKEAESKAEEKAEEAPKAAEPEKETEPKAEEKVEEAPKTAEPKIEETPPAQAPKAEEGAKKNKKINLMSPKDIDAKLKVVKEKMGNLKSRYAKELIKQKDILDKTEKQ